MYQSKTFYESGFKVYEPQTLQHFYEGYRKENGELGFYLRTKGDIVLQRNEDTEKCGSYIYKKIQNGYDKKLYHSIADFTKIVKDILTDISQSFWEKLSFTPFLSLQELLCLKVDDVECRVKHVEKMLEKVMEENDRLQERIHVLECIKVKTD